MAQVGNWIKKKIQKQDIYSKEGYLKKNKIDFCCFD